MGASSHEWFSEPSVQDDTFANRGEQVRHWLLRSTHLRASACRRFLNENLARLPAGAQEEMFHNLQHRWHSAFFELIVARLLQELGASIVYEQQNREGKHPDFIAQFPDGAVTVEAIAPRFDPEYPNRNPLLNIIEENIPTGWWVGVWELPDIGPNDSKRHFRAVVREALDIPPPRLGNEVGEIEIEFDTGTLHLQLIPRNVESKRLGWEASVTVEDNTVARIRMAAKRKRRQVRGTNTPVLLAVHASGMVSDFEDFDRALYGHTYELHSPDRLKEAGFRPDGLFNEPADGDPTFAGVLGFLDVGFHRCTQPVLYRHPRQISPLPAAFDLLEQRAYNPDTNSIEKEPAKVSSVLQGLNFVTV